MASITEKVAFFTLCLFAIIGALTLAIALHEYSHAYDFKDVAKNETICLITTPSSSLNDVLGYYEFEYNQEDKPQIDKIDKYTEPKAYAISLAILLTLTFAMSYVLSHRSQNE